MCACSGSNVQGDAEPGDGVGAGHTLLQLQEGMATQLIKPHPPHNTGISISIKRCRLKIKIVYSFNVLCSVVYPSVMIYSGSGSSNEISEFRIRIQFRTRIRIQPVLFKHIWKL